MLVEACTGTNLFSRKSALFLLVKYFSCFVQEKQSRFLKFATLDVKSIIKLVAECHYWCQVNFTFHQ